MLPIIFSKIIFENIKKTNSQRININYLKKLPYVHSCLRKKLFFFKFKMIDKEKVALEP